MAHWKKSFPSKYLQAADLDVPAVVTVKAILNENVGQGDTVELKPVAQWLEATKAVVLNMTRAEALAELAGSEDMDEWPGTRVLVRQGTTRYQGKKVACIEFAAPPPVTVRRRVSPSAPAATAGATSDLGEPFEEPGDDQVGF